MPVFRENTLEQKGLRNDDSIEMLDIIINSTVPVLTDNYNVGKEMINEICAKINEEDDSVASIIASYKSKIQAELDKINGK